MPDFRRGAPVRAEDLNRTLRAAQTARLAGAAYLSQDNGDALVARDPRRISLRVLRKLHFVPVRIMHGDLPRSVNGRMNIVVEFHAKGSQALTQCLDRLHFKIEFYISVVFKNHLSHNISAHRALRGAP